MLDADRTLVLAGAARGALPEDLLGIDLGELSLAIARRAAPACVCRMMVFGFSSLPAAHAGQFTWQRPHSTQVSASRTDLLPRSLTVSRPTSSFSKSRFGTLPRTGERRNTVIGESTRWKCFDEGISARNARITTACTHQLTRPAVLVVRPPIRQQKRRHQRDDEQTDDDRFDRDARAQRDRADTRATNEQVEDPGEDAGREHGQHGPIAPRTTRRASGRRCRGR